MNFKEEIAVFEVTREYVKPLYASGNIYNTDFCYHEVLLKHDLFEFENYRNNPMDFYVVCTDIESGKAVYRKYEGTEEQSGELLLIRPESKLSVGKVEKNSEKLKEVYEIGRSVAAKRLGEIVQYLGAAQHKANNGKLWIKLRKLKSIFC